MYTWFWKFLKSPPAHKFALHSKKFEVNSRKIQVATTRTNFWCTSDQIVGFSRAGFLVGTARHALARHVMYVPCRRAALARAASARTVKAVQKQLIFELKFCNLIKNRDCLLFWYLLLTKCWRRNIFSFKPRSWADHWVWIRFSHFTFWQQNS